MSPTFNPTKLQTNKLDFDYEITSYDSLGPNKWLKEQRTHFHSQFSGETRKAPDDKVLRSIGYLIWACSLYETKISRANFWLGCLIQDRIIELPGQRPNLTCLIKNFFQFLENEKVSNLFGEEALKFFKEVITTAQKSIPFRDDVVHGHHQGLWSPNIVFRAKGKKFKVDNSYEVSLSSRKLMTHANRILTAAAALSLIDALFDNTLNGY